MFQGFVVKLGTTLPIWRRRSPTTSVLVASPVPGALSPVHADLLPPRKRISFEPYIEPDIDLDIQADIDACIAFANDIAARGTDFRVEDGNAAEEEDFPELVSADGSLEVMQRGLDVVMQELYDHMVEIPIHRVKVIESVQRDQGHTIVATSQQSAYMSKRISTLERYNMRLKGMLGVERERVDRLRYSMSTKTTATRSGMTQDAINELIAKRVEDDLQAYDDAKNRETKTEMENEQQDDNVEVNGNNGNGNDNGNGNPNPLNFKGTEGVVGLTRWFEKIETVFHISNCPPRTIGVDAAYAMTWKALMKLLIKFEKCIGGLLDNIQGNVIAAELVRLHDAIRIANNLMDQKLKAYTIKNAENKRSFDNNSRGNRGQQQQPFKRQNVNGQNVARAYMVRNNGERKGYVGALPYCNKCRMHHEGPCTVKCGNCKRVGHMTKDCKATVAATA
ncbi:putative reverse transcriptase domain-containing protein [Tanacetum coccineum]